MTLSTLSQLSDETLHGEVKRLAGRASTLTAELIAHLGEVEARGIHRERACASLYIYCVYELRMSEDEAQRRCRAARLARQFPALLAMLAESSLHLTGILLIGPHLTAENHCELLARVRYRTKREIEHLVAELAPAPDAPARIEILHRDTPLRVEELGAIAGPDRKRNTWAAYVHGLAGMVRELQSGAGRGQAPPAAATEPGVDWAACEPDNVLKPQVPTLPAVTPDPRYRIQFTADRSYVELLEEARELLQHTVPNRDFVEVQRRALQALVKSLRSRKSAQTQRPRRANSPVAERPHAPAPTPPTDPTAVTVRRPLRAAPARRRHVPAEIRRAIWQRDGGCCAYVDARGQRCREHGGLEFHHEHPHARGGPETAENLALRCRAHNALAAEHDFGKARMRERLRAIRKAPKTEREP